MLADSKTKRTKMKQRQSLKKRDLNNKLVKRKGKLYVINKKNPRMKSRQG